MGVNNPYSSYTGTSTSNNPTRRVGTGRSSVVVPATAAPAPAPIAAPPSSSSTAGMTVANVSPDYTGIAANRAEMYRSPDSQIQAAGQSVLPAYQARLSGLFGPTANAMRLSGQEAINQQYGNSLRAAQQQAGAQGIRGPAAVAMQGDIRNQMGLAQAKFERDLTVADWDAKRQALSDYYNAYRGQAGLGIGTPASLGQLQNTQQGFDGYEKVLAQMYGAAAQRGGGLSSLPMYSSSPFAQAERITGIQSPLTPMLGG